MASHENHICSSSRRASTTTSPTRCSTAPRRRSTRRARPTTSSPCPARWKSRRSISFALDGAEEGGTDYDGFVALGTVIRGETYHFDIVANESARALMDLAVEESLAIGNGILTTENDEQAWVRARRTRRRQGRLRGARGAHHDRAARAARG